MQHSKTFSTLVNRNVTFTTRGSGDSITFALMLEGSHLQLQVNGAFAKSVRILRICRRGAHFLDQDDFIASPPHHCFNRLELRLCTLANRAGVPVLFFDNGSIGGDGAIYGVHDLARDAVTKNFTTVTINSRGSSGALLLEWARPGIKVEERFELWQPASVAIEGPSVFVGAVLKSKPSLLVLLRAIAHWITMRAGACVLIVDSASTEGQLVARELWPLLPACSRAAIVVIPTATVREVLMDGIRDSTTCVQGGAAVGYSIALALYPILAELETDSCAAQSPIALVDRGAWTACATTLLPVLTEHLLTEIEGDKNVKLVAFRQSAVTGMSEYLIQVSDAYASSRPYINGFIDAGANEGDVRVAVELSSKVLRDFATDTIACLESDNLNHIEQVLAAGLRPPQPALQSTSPAPKSLVPVGRAARELTDAVQDCLDGRIWRVGNTQSRQEECLVILDMTDKSSCEWLHDLQAMGGDAPPVLHCILLVPALGAPRTTWGNVAAPLAFLISGESIDLGLALIATVDEFSIQNFRFFFRALSLVHFHDIGFQLRPRPRVALCSIARLRHEVAHELVTATGTIIAKGEVSASFSLWPSCTSVSMVDQEFLCEELPPALARAGAAYPVDDGVTFDTDCVAGGVWHFCAHTRSEVLVYRRAAGDFAGRQEGEFKWRGGEDGDSMRLWELAEELDGKGGADDQPVVIEATEDAADAGSLYSDDAYEQESDEDEGDDD